MLALSSHPPSWVARLASLAVLPAAATLSVAMVAEASFTAYRDTTTGGSGSSVGQVILADDDTGSAAFAASNLVPGASGERCIVVTSDGRLASTVKLYGTDSRLGPIASHIRLTIVQGSGGTFGSCTGFVPDRTTSTVWDGTLADFGSAATGYATGAGDWRLDGTGVEARTFKISYRVSPQAPDSTQGNAATMAFTWEERSD